jgi:hypothetical protein
MGPESSHRSARIDHVAALDSAPGVHWKPLRRVLGIDAFGVNAFVAERAGGLLVEPHTEHGPGAAGHQELYVVLEGAAAFTIDEQRLEAPAGTLVFVPRPESQRTAVATADGTTVLAIGAPAGRPFTPSAWEFSASAPPPGDIDRAGDVARQGVRIHTDEPSLLYNLACYESLAGRVEEALAHLARAVELDPRRAEWAKRDADFDPIRMLPGFPAHG